MFIKKKKKKKNQCNLKACKKHSIESIHIRTANVKLAKMKYPIMSYKKIIIKTNKKTIIILTATPDELFNDILIPLSKNTFHKKLRMNELN